MIVAHYIALGTVKKHPLLGRLGQGCARLFRVFPVQDEPADVMKKAGDEELLDVGRFVI
jgi:hypothetical protein